MITFFSLLFWTSFILLAWTYFGYPLFMFLRSKIQSYPVTKDGTIRPKLTLLIPAYNEADVIRRKLTNSLELDYPVGKLEILVVDDGSDDGTANIVREFEDKGVKLLQQPQRGGKVAAMNRGFAQASGEIVVLSDASPSFEKDALPLLVRAFADPKVGVVVGKLALWDAENAVAKPAGLYWKYEAALRKWESATGSTVGVHGNMFAVRKSVYGPLATSTVNDEFSIAMETIRQGYRIIYEPDAISYDDASTKMGDEFKRRTRINAGRYQALFSVGYLNAPNLDTTFRLFSHKLLRPLAPILMVIMVVANVLAVVWPNGAAGISILPLSSGLALLLLIGQIAFYGAAYLGWILEQQGKQIKLLNVIYYFVSSNLAALVGFWRWLRRTQRVTWQKRSLTVSEKMTAGDQGITQGITHEPRP